MPVNQLKAGAALNYVILGLNALTGLLYTPYMLRMLGQNEYGIYTLAASVISYLSLLDFGFGNAMVRYTAKYRAQNDTAAQYRLFGTFTVVYSILGLLSFAGGLILYFNVDTMFGNTMTAAELSQTRIIMMLLIINLAASFPLGIYGSIITAYEDFIFLRVVSIARILVSTGVLITILYMGYKAVGLVVVQTVFNFLGLGINYVYCRSKLKIRVIFSRFNWPLVKEISAYSFWIFLGVIMDKIYWATGQFILGMKISTVAVAVYSLALTLEGIYMSYSLAISSVFLPRVTTMVTQSASPRDISDLFVRTGRIQFIIMALIVSGFTVFGRQFIGIWAGPDYAGSFPIALIFFCALFVPLIQNLGITILQARNQMQFRSLLYVAIALVTLGVQIVVAPRYGGLGCAWAIAGALGFGQGLIMNIYYWRRQQLDIPRFWHEILKMSIVPALMTAGGLLAMQYVRIDNIVTLLLCIIGYAAIYIPLFYIFSMRDSERRLFSDPLRRLVAPLCRKCS